MVDYNEFEIITALRKIIIDSILIINMYGFPSYLKEDKDIYFLIENLSLKLNIIKALFVILLETCALFPLKFHNRDFLHSIRTQ